MKIAAIIGEFNPFHNGHRLIIQRAHELGADRVIVLMSGDFVQRGLPAITDSHTRAHMALLGGADAILWYPARFSSSSAESFASHAVDILNGLGCVDMLVFGSESGDLSRMSALADILADEPEDYRQKLREGLKAGLSFPKARAEAIPEYADLISSPNNILGVEYLKALKRTGSKIKPFTCVREGSSYLDDSTLGALSSAASVRRALAQGNHFPGLEIAVPKDCLDVLRKDLGIYGVTNENDFSLLLAERLWQVGAPFLLTKFADVTEDLANTIFKKRGMFLNFDDFADRCVSKSLTKTHVYRAFLHIVLDVQKNSLLDGARLTQVLGFRKESTDVISKIQTCAEIPVIMNPPAEKDRLPDAERKLFEDELRISSLYEMVRAQKVGRPVRNVLTKELIKV